MTLLILALLSPIAHAEPPSREAMRQAMDACAAEKGLSKPAPGQRPSEADRKVMDECLAGKGFQRPAGPPPRHH